MRTVTSKTHVNLLSGYAVAGAVWLLFSMLMSPMAGLHLGLTALALFLMIEPIAQRNRENDWPRFVAQWLTPLMLWLTFGLGSIPTFLRLERMAYYGRYTDAAIQTFGLYVFLGAFCYVFCFRLAYGAQLGQGTRSDPNEVARSDRTDYSTRTVPFVIALLAFDWFVRMDQIAKGLYFTWLQQVGRGGSVRGTSLIYHVHDTFSWILLAFLTYLALRAKRFRTAFRFLTVIQLLLAMFTGSRSLFLIGISVVLFSYLYISGRRITWKMVTIILLAFLLFFGALSPGVEAARLMMRREAHTLRREPLQIPVLFVTQYLPGALGLGDDRSYEREMEQRQGMVARIGGYTAYAASINQSLMDRKRPLRDLDEFGTRLKVLVPRVLLSEKSAVTAGADLLQHFRLGRRGMDPNGTHAADIFSFLHVVGILAMLAIGGTYYGFASRFLLARFGQLGGLIIIGILPAFLPYADSFTAYLTSMRNVALAIVVICVVFWGKERWRSPARQRPTRLPVPQVQLGRADTRP